MAGLADSQIEQIERQLRCRLPVDVRKAYARADGLSGPTDCQLLYPLESEHNILHANKVLKAEDWFPAEFQPIAILGDDGCGNLIGFDPRVPEAILWNPADGEWIQEKKGTVSELWELIRESYANDA